MPRTAFSLLLPLVLTCLNSGCLWKRPAASVAATQALPASEAPVIELALESTPTISTVSHQLEPKFAFVDARPPEERLYYPGDTNPRRMHDAMTILPLESFQPQFETALRQQIVKSLPNAVDYEKIEVRIESFHVALDERDRAAEELQHDLERWDDERDHKETLDEEERREREEQKDREQDRSFEDKLASAFFRTVITEPARRSKRRRHRYELSKVAPQTLPVSLTTGKEAGWNSRFNTTVTLLTDDGQTKSFPVSVNMVVPDEGGADVKELIQRTVDRTIVAFGHEVRNMAK